MYTLEDIQAVDMEVADAITKEFDRQNSHIELIASENWVSPAVMSAMGSVMTNKYAEGYPGKRYYGGCDCVDIVENLAIERAKELFGCDYVNVQPHSGAQANMAVQFAILKPGDTVMGMNLDHGGHLTHGSPVNFSGTYFHIVPYGVNDEGFIDYDNVMQIAMELLQVHPHMQEPLISRNSVKLQMPVVQFLWLIWHISQDLLQQDFIQAQSHMQML